MLGALSVWSAYTALTCGTRHRSATDTTDAVTNGEDDAPKTMVTATYPALADMAGLRLPGCLLGGVSLGATMASLVHPSRGGECATQGEVPRHGFSG